jgi:hypothetical protein
VLLRPKPSLFQPPGIDDVTDEVDGVRIAGAQEIEQQPALASPRAEMDVRDEDRAVAADPGSTARLVGCCAARTKPACYCSRMTSAETPLRMRISWTILGLPAKIGTALRPPYLEEIRPVPGLTSGSESGRKKKLPNIS